MPLYLQFGRFSLIKKALLFSLQTMSILAISTYHDEPQQLYPIKIIDEQIRQKQTNENHTQVSVAELQNYGLL
jgi:cell division protein FtsL